MKKRGDVRHVGAGFVFGIAVLFLIVPDAHAYVDPGSGAFLWQLLVAALVGMLFYAKTIIRKIKSVFRRRNDEG